MGLYYLCCVFDMHFADRRSRNHKLSVYMQGGLSWICRLSTEVIIVPFPLSLSQKHPPDADASYLWSKPDMCMFCHYLQTDGDGVFVVDQLVDSWWVEIRALLLCYNPYCLSYLAHLNSIGGPIQAIWAAEKTYILYWLQKVINERERERERERACKERNKIFSLLWNND